MLKGDPVSLGLSANEVQEEIKFPKLPLSRGKILPVTDPALNLSKLLADIHSLSPGLSGRSIDTYSYYKSISL